MKIKKAINNILNENYKDMQENIIEVLAEKVAIKLEEKKREIATDYLKKD